MREPPQRQIAAAAPFPRVEQGSSDMRHAFRLAAAAGILAVSTAATVAQEAGGTYRNDRHGFTLKYPAAQFIALPIATEDGRQFISTDGKARLLAGTVANVDKRSLKSYRDYLIRETYAGADITYAPVRDNRFVLSGIKKDGTLFYQRVNFLCGGRSINSWAMLLPAADKPLYQPVIDAVHRDYRAGTGKLRAGDMKGGAPCASLLSLRTGSHVGR
jgi:hypothetical protein